MDTSGFYNNDEGSLLFAPNIVSSPDFELLREKKDEYSYPVNGWSWFDSEEEAKTELGIKEVADLSAMQSDINNIIDVLNERRML